MKEIFYNICLFLPFFCWNFLNLSPWAVATVTSHGHQPWAPSVLGGSSKSPRKSASANIVPPSPPVSRIMQAYLHEKCPVCHQAPAASDRHDIQVKNDSWKQYEIND